MTGNKGIEGEEGGVLIHFRSSRHSKEESQRDRRGRYSSTQKRYLISPG